MHFRVGLGYDVHVFAEGRDLILGGIAIDYELGLMGHSDADVLLHAVTDALLGAAGMGDIGEHFPDTDARYKGANSAQLLRQCVDLIQARGWRVNNIDATIIAEQPKLSAYKLQIGENIAALCGVNVACVNIKATTNEKMGFVGRLEGIAVHAVASLVGSELTE